MDAEASTRGIEEPNKDAGASTGRLKEPNADANTSVYGMEKPNVDAYDTTYGSKEPNMNVGNSTNSQKESAMDVGAFTSVKEPNMDVDAPTNSTKELNINAGASTSTNEPNMDVSAPTNSEKEPIMDVGAPANSAKEPNMDVDVPTNSRKEPNMDAGASTSTKEPNMHEGPSSSMEQPKYGIEKPNQNTSDSAYSNKESNAGKYGGNYSYENPYTGKYGSNYSYDNPYADDYDPNYSFENPYADDYDDNYSYDKPYTDQYDSNYSYDNPYTDDYDSYGHEDPYKDTYDSTYGNEDPNKDAYDSSYRNEDRKMKMDAYDSSYGNEDRKMKMDAYDSSYANEDRKMNVDADASGTGEPKSGRSPQCSMCCYFAPTKEDLLKHYNTELHKYINDLDRKRRSLVIHRQTLDDVIKACGKSEALIGLEYIYQYAPSKNGLVLYGCKLCQSVYRLDLMYLHIVSPKHRIMYLSKHHPEMGIDIEFTLNVPADYDRLNDNVQTVEQKFGRKRICYLDTCYSQNKPIGEMDAPPVAKKKPSRWNSLQSGPQSTDKWNDGDNYNNEPMDLGGDTLPQSYNAVGPPSSHGQASLQYGSGEGRGGPGNVNRFSRRNRFSSPTDEPVPQNYNSSGFPGNRNTQSATQKGGIPFNYPNRQGQGAQNRQGLESGPGNADDIRRPNQDNRNVPNRMRNQANDFPDDRRAASRFDNRQGSGKQDRFSNSDDRQKNRDQFSRNERRDQNNAPGEGRLRPGDRDNSRFDRRARSPDNSRRGSEKQGFSNAEDRRRNNDRLSRNDRRDQNVASRGRQNRQGDKRNRTMEFHDYEDDFYGKADERREAGKDSNERPGNQSSGEVGNRSDDQKGPDSADEPKEETDPDRIFVFSTFGNNATFLELKNAYKAGHIMSGQGQDKDQAKDQDSDMDARSMDLSDGEEEEAGFLFNQELFEFLNNYIVKSEKDEHFVLEARALLSKGLTDFDMKEKERLEEVLETEMPIEESTSDTLDQCLVPIKNYFSYNDTDERDEMDDQDDDDEDEDSDDDDVDLNDVWAQLVASQSYLSSGPREVLVPQPARGNKSRTRFSS